MRADDAAAFADSVADAVGAGALQRAKDFAAHLQQVRHAGAGQAMSWTRCWRATAAIELATIDLDADQIEVYGRDEQAQRATAGSSATRRTSPSAQTGR